MITFRSPEMDKKYNDWKEAGGHKENDGCLFCSMKRATKEYKYWIITKNDFPYDRYFRICDMLSPRRHVATLEELTVEEHLEYLKLRKELSIDYNVLLENFGDTKTISHFHVHLLVYNDREKSGRLIK